MNILQQILIKIQNIKYMRCIIERIQDNGKQTKGRLLLYNQAGYLLFTCDTLELSWKDNKQQISCIPTGTYKVVTTYSNKYKKEMYEILAVPKRAGVRIHSGNYYTDIQGCVLVGKGFADINEDGIEDILSSKKTLEKFSELAGREFILEIKKI